MDDLRVLWMRDRLYTAFGITDPQLFEELLNRNDGEVEDLILHFLNQSSDEEGASTLFFYRKVVPEEVEVEVEVAIGEPCGRPPAAPHLPGSLPMPARSADPQPTRCSWPLVQSANVYGRPLCRRSPGTGRTGQALTVHLESQTLNE